MKKLENKKLSMSDQNLNDVCRVREHIKKEGEEKMKDEYQNR